MEDAWEGALEPKAPSRTLPKGGDHPLRGAFNLEILGELVKVTASLLRIRQEMQEPWRNIGQVMRDGVTLSGRVAG